VRTPRMGLRLTAGLRTSIRSAWLDERTLFLRWLRGHVRLTLSGWSRSKWSTLLRTCTDKAL